MPKTASATFVRRQIAAEFRPVFWHVEPDGVYGRFANLNDGPGAIFLDNFSDVTLLRPLLALSDTGPIVLPAAKPGESVVSPLRTVSNGQRRTAPRQLDDRPAEQVATVLYGMAGVPRTEPAVRQRLTEPSDDVGAVLLGDQAGLFEFVNRRRGSASRSLHFRGAKGTSGLRGGQNPESTELVVRFKGSDRPGEYRTTVRIVTQAMNTGVLERRPAR